MEFSKFKKLPRDVCSNLLHIFKLFAHSEAKIFYFFFQNVSEKKTPSNFDIIQFLREISFLGISNCQPGVYILLFIN